MQILRIATFLIITLLALTIYAARTTPPQAFTLLHTHVVTCSARTGRIDVMIGVTLQKIVWTDSSREPYCDSWNKATYWDIRLHGEKTEYVFEWAQAVQ